jgi:hypothetical protein
MAADILHRDFKAQPYWWEAYRPVSGELVEVPKKARVVIVGGGYAALSCAIELADAGIDACVLRPNWDMVPARRSRRGERWCQCRQELYRQDPDPRPEVIIIQLRRQTPSA